MRFQHPRQMDDGQPTWNWLLHTSPFGERGLLHVLLGDRHATSGGAQDGTPLSREGAARRNREAPVQG